MLAADAPPEPALDQAVAIEITGAHPGQLRRDPGLVGLEPRLVRDLEQASEAI